MTRMQLYSEPFASTGNIAGEGFGNLLGRPALGMVQTVIRESIQNSIDAARLGSGPSVLIRVRTLDEEELAALRDNVLGQLPEERDSRSKLEKYLAGPFARVMEVCDFNTTGLGGPLSADTPADSESPDFVNFVRNVGVPRDTDQGGGTYGYGKTVLYAMSGCATILLDTMTSHQGLKERRFIGCHLGDAFDGKMSDGTRRRFTGRYWWGDCRQAGSVDPVRDDSAVELAGRIGLPPRDETDPGTSVMILDPQFYDDENDQAICDDLVETLLWNFWPRMIASTSRERRLDVTIEIEGRAYPIPRPEDFPPLDLYASALEQIRHSPEQAKAIRCGRPRAHLGRLAFCMGVKGERWGPATRKSSSIPAQNAAIALMRPVELVVRYMEGTHFPDDRYEWAGVFVCSDELAVEYAFSRAEPPAHDDWLYENLPKGNDKTWVKVGLERLRDWARSYAMPHSNITDDQESGPSLARAATLLGKMLGEGEGQGPGRKRKARSNSRSRKPKGLSSPVFVRLEDDEDAGTCAVFCASLNCRSDSQRIIAEPYLVMDGGQTTDEGLGKEFEVSVLSMTLVDTGTSVGGDVMEVGETEGTLEVRVAMPPSAAVSLKLTLEGGDA
ncbi:hypothetical protein [Halomonas elongata]|uniref:Uncharacterized protein n=1 Tax=Halomonas elongata (strain ATCC 33173 / DSM 2581 / NBRC 15536 / NCIMB 2198 / 1H9) TaxID=768066 RepID=E1VCB3_HALED|nr:hypothetical protein [Halomonas elongata]WBF18052.1 hypothetical protein LM502_18635 [Halomonas elongata]WPU46902.1 hypothetical protein SR933_16880 [Halomonas elongata DSM 2581]CBV44283.1 uncharacterized protein HELO_4399 [Halomonas elongata DSM 2581]